MTGFETIRARAAARKGGDAVLASLLGSRADNAMLAAMPDDRILSAMAQRIFSAGFVWSVIEQKWDGFVLSRDMVAALRDAGVDLAESPTSKKDLRKVQDQINAWAAETGLARAHISRILALSIGENRSAEALREYMGE